MADSSNPDWEEAVHLYETLMSRETESVRVKATLKLANDYIKCLPESMLSRTIPMLVSCLSEIPSTNSLRALQMAAVYCLKRIASQGTGRLANEIAHAGAIEHITRLISDSNDPTFQLLLVKCLWILVSFGDECRMVLARNGGIEFVVEMLDYCLDGTWQYLLEILSTLALLKEERRKLVRVRGGIGYLIQAAASGSMVSRERACQAIGLLGVFRAGRRLLSRRGAIPVLVELFAMGDDQTKLVAANSLGIISAHPDSVRPAARAGAIPVYAELLQGAEPVGREIAEDVFSVLAVAESNALSIANHVVAILKKGNDESKAAAADVLWNIAVYKHPVPVIKNAGAIPVLVQLLMDGNMEIREKVSAVISLLRHNKEDKDTLVYAGAIPLLVDLLRDEAPVCQNAAEALVSLYEDPDHRNRVVEEIDISNMQGMLHQVAKIREADERIGRSLRRMRRPSIW